MFLLSGHNTMKNARFKIGPPTPPPRNLVILRRERGLEPPKPAPAEKQAPKRPMHRIIDLVARMHGVTYFDVMSEDRTVRVVLARYAAICAVKTLRRTLTLGQVGKLFRRDHTSILSAYRQRGFR